MCRACKQGPFNQPFKTILERKALDPLAERLIGGLIKLHKAVAPIYKFTDLCPYEWLDSFTASQMQPDAASLSLDLKSKVEEGTAQSFKRDELGYLQQHFRFIRQTESETVR